MEDEERARIQKVLGVISQRLDSLETRTETFERNLGKVSNRLDDLADSVGTPQKRKGKKKKEKERCLKLPTPMRDIYDSIKGCLGKGEEDEEEEEEEY